MLGYVLWWCFYTSLAVVLAVFVVVALLLLVASVIRLITVVQGAITTRQARVHCSADVHANEVNQAVMRVVERQILSGYEDSIQVTSYWRGKRIVNVWADHTSAKQQVQESSIFMPFSVAKGVAATALALCVEQGKIHYDERVSKYWPEFGFGGKGDVAVGDAVSHRACIYPTSFFPLLDFTESTSDFKWRKGVAWVESCSPPIDRLPKEGMAEYHQVSYSWIIGGLIEAATGQHITTIVKQLASRLDMADEMWMGVLPPDVKKQHHCPTVTPTQFRYPVNAKEKQSFTQSVVQFAMWPVVWLEVLVVPYFATSLWWSSMCLPSSNGFWSARAVGKM